MPLRGVRLFVGDDAEQEDSRTPRRCVPTCQLEIFRRGWCFSGFDPHGKKGAKKQNDGAPDLRGSEPFAKKKRGKPEGTGGTKKLESLRESNSDLPDRDIVENVRESDAGHRGNNQNDIHAGADVKRCCDCSEGQSER